jgi:hypothetical protein
MSAVAANLNPSSATAELTVGTAIAECKVAVVEGSGRSVGS